MKKFLTFAIAVVLLGYSFVFYSVQSMKEWERTTEIREVQNQIDALNREKEVLEQELVVMKNAASDSAEAVTYQSSVVYIPQYAYAFISPGKKAVEEIQSLMAKSSLTGLLTFKQNEIPGKKDTLLSESLYKNLVSEGWETALSIGEKTNLSKDQETASEEYKTVLSKYLDAFQNQTGVKPHILWVEKKNYRTWLDPVLKELGIDTICYTDPATEISGSSLTCIPAVPYLTVEEVFKEKGYSHYQFLTFDCRKKAAREVAYRSDALTELTSDLVESTGLGILTINRADAFIKEAKKDADLIRAKAQEHADALNEILKKNNFSEINEESIMNRIAEIDEEIKELYR